MRSADTDIPGSTFAIVDGHHRGDPAARDDGSGAHDGPRLIVSGPGRPPEPFELAGARVTVGRQRDCNDIVLTPDPERLVTKQCHCALVRDLTRPRDWYLVDEASTNGTFVRHAGREVEIHGKHKLAHGDVIRILATLGETGAQHWELVFEHPSQTFVGIPDLRLEYDWTQRRLWRYQRGLPTEIETPRPKVHKLLRYMLQRNIDNGGSPVLCTYDELIRAVWENEPLHTRQEVNGLIRELRRKVELDPAKPQFVRTALGDGYRLHTRPALDARPAPEARPTELIVPDDESGTSQFEYPPA